ncbi:ABC transporter permease [Alkaliphilus pronyensis]|uniref:ABC transporter permease n=1 Tax=Alkaliphilus pronyensis TaxID=1482732 RepID=UPI001FAB29EA|nr:hypothetical protein [Alkaliphilus pronyensis]
MKDIKLIKQGKALGIRLLLICGFLICWELFTSTGFLDPFYTSKPSLIYKDLQEFYNSGALMKHTAITLQEAIWGLIIGTAIGISVGFLLGLVNILGRIFEPIITALYGIPKLALAPIFAIWFGLGIKSK